MGVSYDEKKFWGVLFSRTGSTVPLTQGNVLVMTAWAAVVCVLQHFDEITAANGGPMPYAVLTGFLASFIGIMTSFRLSDAFNRWSTANRLVLRLAGTVGEICAKLIAYLPPDDPECLEEILEMRRLMILSCVMLKMHVRCSHSRHGACPMLPQRTR